MVDVAIITEGISDLSKVGGVSSWLRDLIKGLHQISFSIINFTFEENSLNKSGSSLPNLKSFNNVLLKNYPLNTNQIEDTLKNSKLLTAKIYHATSTGCASLCGMYLSKLENKPFILTEHVIYWKEAQETNELECGIEVSKKITNELKTIAKRAYKEARAITTPTDFTRDIQIREGANSTKCTVINNGVDPAEFKFSYRFPIERIGFVGRITRIKNIEKIVKIWKVMSYGKPHLKFFIIGPIEDLVYYNELKKLINSLNLAPKTEFIECTKREEWTNYIDALFLASKMETQPYVVLEALSSGILTIVPNVGGLSETVRDTGIVYDIKAKDKEVANEIENLIFREEYLRRKILKGKKLIEEIYNINKMLDKYDRLYKKFL